MNVTTKKAGPLILSEIVTLNFEDFPVIQVAFHRFQDVVRKAHADEGVRNLFVPVDLTQLEEASGNGGRILEDPK